MQSRRPPPLSMRQEPTVEGAHSCRYALSAGRPGTRAPDASEPFLHVGRSAEGDYVCVCGVRSDFGEQYRSTDPSPANGPCPKVAPLASSSHGSPRAPPQREVEDDHRVGPAQSGRNVVVGSEVAIHDPPVGSCKLTLTLCPHIARHHFEFVVPELFVELTTREVRNLWRGDVRASTSRSRHVRR